MYLFKCICIGIVCIDIAAALNIRNRRGLFGPSVFENEKIALNPIGEIEYDYKEELDNDIPDVEEDLYTEDFYGDYDDTFVPPVPVTTPRNANPFGVAINFDDYKLSDIRNVEYEYDYDEYEDTEIETNEVGDGDADFSPDAINETENTLTPPRTVSQSHPRPHLNTNPHAPRFNPTQLQYMGMVNRPHKPGHQHKQKQPSRLRSGVRGLGSLSGLVTALQAKVELLLRAVTRKLRIPHIL